MSEIPIKSEDQEGRPLSDVERRKILQRLWREAGEESERTKKPPVLMTNLGSAVVHLSSKSDRKSR